MSIVLSEATNSEKTVESALKLVAVNKTELADSHRKLTVGVRLILINENSAGAVHRLNAEGLLVDLGGIHIVLIVIPVTAGFPELTVHDKGS